MVDKTCGDHHGVAEFDYAGCLTPCTQVKQAAAVKAAVYCKAIVQLSSAASDSVQRRLHRPAPVG